MKANICFQDGDAVREIEFVLPPTALPNLKSAGVFAMAKAGSVLVNRVAGQLFSEVGVPVIDWPDLCHAKGIDFGSIQGDLSLILPHQGYCIAGFRELPRSFLGAPSLRDLRKILVVRDPRDMLVSRYFSTKFSHGFQELGTLQFRYIIKRFIEDANLDVDEFCLSYSWWIGADLFAYRELAEDKNTLVIRYEDFVYDKSNLVFSIADWCGLDISKDRLITIAEENSEIPSSENPYRHVRQAHPGDYINKLKPDTISALNMTLGSFMRTFGYTP